MCAKASRGRPSIQCLLGYKMLPRGLGDIFRPLVVVSMNYSRMKSHKEGRKVCTGPPVRGLTASLLKVLLAVSPHLTVPATAGGGSVRVPVGQMGKPEPKKCQNATETYPEAGRVKVMGAEGGRKVQGVLQGGHRARKGVQWAPGDHST